MVKAKITIELTVEEARDLLRDLYQNMHEYQETPLGKLSDELSNVLG